MESKLFDLTRESNILEVPQKHPLPSIVKMMIMESVVLVKPQDECELDYLVDR
jgi:hypothetical protein